MGPTAATDLEEGERIGVCDGEDDCAGCGKHGRVCASRVFERLRTRWKLCAEIDGGRAGAGPGGREKVSNHLSPKLADLGSDLGEQTFSSIPRSTARRDWRLVRCGAALSVSASCSSIEAAFELPLKQTALNAKLEATYGVPLTQFARDPSIEPKACW